MAVYLYHFHTSQGGVLHDHVGGELASDHEAIQEGIIAAEQLMRTGVSAAMGGAFEIHDTAGRFIARVPIGPLSV